VEDRLFLRENIARLDLGALTKAQGAAVRLVQFLICLAEQFGRDKVIIRASGLAYSSLLATVPLVAVIYSVLSAFGALDELKVKVQNFLLSNFLPTQHGDIVDLIDHFTANTAKLGSVGFAFLALAAVLLLDNIESNFNDIYHVSSRRRLVSKVTAYTSVLVFGTLFIGASLSISARVETMFLRGVAVDLSWLSRLMSWFFPFALAFLAFLVVFMVAPFTRVRVKSAVLGATVSAILFEVSKYLFAGWVGQSVRYSTIYGSLAVVPIFLIWLYVVWIVVLLGLEVAFTHQYFLTLLRSRVLRGGPEGDRVATGLRLFTLIVQRFDGGEDPPTCDQLSRRLLVPREIVDDLLAHLEEDDLIRRVALGSSTEGIVPARPPEAVTVSEVIEAFQAQLIELLPNRAAEEVVNELVSGFLAAGHQEMGGATFRTVLDRVSGAADD
jgi:membrane protein